MPGTLDHSPADVVRRLLIDLGLGAAPPAASSAWPIYTGGEPNLPDQAITVTDTEGRGHGRDQVTGERQEHHGISIMVRAATFPAGYAKARDVATALDAQYQDVTTLGAARYLVHAVTRTSDVFSLGKESPQSKRSLFSVNALVSLRQL